MATCHPRHFELIRALPPRAKFAMSVRSKKADAPLARQLTPFSSLEFDPREEVWPRFA